MKKLFIGIVALIFICVIIVYALSDKVNVNKIISNFEKKTGLKVELQDNSIWIFYPSITYRNNKITITHNKSMLEIKDAEININKSYWPMSPFHVDLVSPTANYKGMEIRNLVISAKYNSNIANIENFSGQIVGGNLHLKGKLDLDDEQLFYIKGKFTNVSLNTLLKQSKIAVWERVNITLSSPNLNLSGEAKNTVSLTNSLIGTIPISGSFYLNSSEEERFGAALLSLLVEKIPRLSPISQSLNFLLSKYANVPSSLKGDLIIKNGLIKSNEILIVNKEAKSKVKGSYDFLNNKIDGKIYFYNNNDIFLEASLKGKIENPQILVGGKVFTDNNEQPLQDIKQLFDEGINSLIDKLLQSNE